MKNKVTAVLGFAVLLNGAFATDQVYYNAKVFTADATTTGATAFVVKDGKFIYVGDDAGAKKYGEGTDLQGKRVIPGMVETHTHPIMNAVGKSLKKIVIPHTYDTTQVVELIREKAKEPGREDCVLGFGFGPPCGKNPLATTLDEAVSDRPVLLVAFDGHSAWGNSKLFEKAGITKDTPDPIPGGSYFARDADGNPSGFMAETSTLYPTMRKLDMGVPAKMEQPLLSEFAMFNSFGITTMFDAAMLNIKDDPALQLLTKIQNDGKMTMRYHTVFTYQGRWQMTPEQGVERLKELDKKYSAGLLQVKTLKLFNDGTVEPTSAAMFEDYCPPGKGRGGLVLQPDEAYEAAKLATDAGYSIHTHAVGDRAISNALDVYEKLGPIQGTKAIAHVEIPKPKDVERFIKMQDVFCDTTLNWTRTFAGQGGEFRRDVLGPERYPLQFPVNTLRKGGVLLTFGYDSIGNDICVSPFYNSYFGVLRGTDTEGIVIPPHSEGLTIEDCMIGYTINGAKQLRIDDKVGSITTGKEADFVILDRDVFNVPVKEIKEVNVEKTFLRGKCVFDRATSPLVMGEDGYLKGFPQKY